MRSSLWQGLREGLTSTGCAENGLFFEKCGKGGLWVFRGCGRASGSVQKLTSQAAGLRALRACSEGDPRSHAAVEPLTPDWGLGTGRYPLS